MVLIRTWIFVVFPIFPLHGTMCVYLTLIWTFIQYNVLSYICLDRYRCIQVTFCRRNAYRPGLYVVSMSRRARNIPSSTGTVRRLNETNILAQAKILSHLHLPCFTALARLLLDSDLYFEPAPGCANIIFNCACSVKMIVECHNICCLLFLFIPSVECTCSL